MKPDLTALLGQTVVVDIDRPLGSHHPRHANLVYPLNYGEIAGTVSGDGNPIDAYVLGSDTPLQTVEGHVVAVVIRDDDNENKLVVATTIGTPTADEIWRAVIFQEQYFRSRLVLAQNGERVPRHHNDDS